MSVEQKDVDWVIHVARGAGDLARRMYASGQATVKEKSSEIDLVTAADVAAEEFVREALARLYPGVALWGEESNHPPSQPDYWLVDPIDGTTNFLYGLAGWAVSIAAVDDTDTPEGTLAGAVYLPATRELFVAARGHGAWLGGRRLRCSSNDDMATALVGTGFSYSSDRRARQGDRVARLLPRVRDIRRTGAAAPDLCYVADGRLDAYFEEGLQAWDLAAGLLIATEAGARASDFNGGSPVPSNVLVAAPDLHAHLLEFIGPSPTERAVS